MDDFNNLEIDDLEVILTSTVVKITEEEAQTISGGTSASIKDIGFSDKIALDRILKPEVITIAFPLPTSGACFACGRGGLDPRIDPRLLPQVNCPPSVCEDC
ncbi:hypothetical protein [Moorena producens]|uniref:hypothetical protein n=1 Tax=Moorena producens TaxID=1155739 RepID=UPI003C7250C4